jgi:hypothetical protein
MLDMNCFVSSSEAVPNNQENKFVRETVVVSIPMICMTLGFMSDDKGVCIGLEGLEPSSTMVKREVLCSLKKFVTN